MIMMGMMIESYDKSKDIPTEGYFMWALSPFIFPIVLGMVLAESKSKDNE
jgi:hypothetical protein